MPLKNPGATASVSAERENTVANENSIFSKIHLGEFQGLVFSAWFFRPGPVPVQEWPGAFSSAVKRKFGDAFCAPCEDQE